VDFLIIGAMKSGTSSLWALMREHPDIWVPMPKELPFFNGPEHDRGWDAFARRNLRGAPPGAKVGKATPSYMAGAPLDPVEREDLEREIPERIARQFPDIKLIAILRDPVERAVSQYTMGRNVGAETRGPDEAFEQLLQPAALARARRDPHGLEGYVVLGEYGRLLRGYLDVFGSSQLLPLSTAQLSDDPRSVLERVWRFVGVDDYVPADLHQRYMVSAELGRRHRVIGLFDGRRRSVRAARRAFRALPPSIGDPIRRRFWTPLLRSVASKATDPGSPSPPPQYAVSPDLRRKLEAHYEADSEQLVEMFGWSPLNGEADLSRSSPAPPASSPATDPASGREPAPEQAGG
jgi:Sulfotransferase domain